MNQIEQAELAQRALDDFKVQVEKNSAKMYDEMKLQVILAFQRIVTCKHNALQASMRLIFGILGLQLYILKLD
jgi:hypothetical protein